MSASMLRVNRILKNERFAELMAQLEKLESDRQFCRHGMEHLLNTARIMYISALENGFSINKDIIYAAALLHDIGRIRQYVDNTPHQRASADIAAEILPLCGYTQDETSEIICAVLCHRHDSTEVCGRLGELLHYADKASRLCFNCKAVSECYWSEESKNFDITV